MHQLPCIIKNIDHWSRSWSSSVEGDEQMDWPKSQISMKCCHACDAEFVGVCHKHNSSPHGPIRPSSISMCQSTWSKSLKLKTLWFATATRISFHKNSRNSQPMSTQHNKKIILIILCMSRFTLFLTSLRINFSAISTPECSKTCWSICPSAECSTSAIGATESGKHWWVNCVNWSQHKVPISQLKCSIMLVAIC